MAAVICVFLLSCIFVNNFIARVDVHMYRTLAPKSYVQQLLKRFIGRTRQTEDIFALRTSHLLYFGLSAQPHGQKRSLFRDVLIIRPVGVACRSV